MPTNLTLLSDRGIVEVSGADVDKFLDSMITNDLGRLAPGEALLAALLTPQGKILFEFLIIRSGAAFLLDVASGSATDLVKRLNFYKLRAAVIVTDLSAGMTVAATWGDVPPSVPGGVVCVADPRHADLGFRLIMPASRADELPRPSASEADYHAHRIALRVPEGGRDYPLGDTFPHEANFDLLNGVSFTKGCYVGQEVVSRMQNKTVVRKRIVRITGDSLKPGADIMHGAGVVGTVGSVQGEKALAMLRLDRAIEAATKGPALSVAGRSIAVDAAALDAYRDSVANKPAPGS